MIERMEPLESVIELYRQGCHREAELVCERHLASHADDPAALSLLADIRVSSGRFEESLPVLWKLIRLHPRDGAAFRKLGLALSSTRCPAEAIDLLQRGVELEPGNVNGRTNLGQALAEGRPDRGGSLRRARIELSIFYVGEKEDLETQQARQSADQYRSDLRPDPHFGAPDLR